VVNIRVFNVGRVCDNCSGKCLYSCNVEVMNEWSYNPAFPYYFTGWYYLTFAFTGNNISGLPHSRQISSKKTTIQNTKATIKKINAG
jgi:hypothetical protein